MMAPLPSCPLPDLCWPLNPPCQEPHHAPHRTTESLPAARHLRSCLPLANFDAWFTPDYCQEVNGERLDYPAFRQHIAALRRHLAGANIEFVATMALGERAHSTHLVRPPATMATPWSAR